jgi:hypothetical protein
MSNKPQLCLCTLSIFLLLLLRPDPGAACSLYKITLEGKTVLGNNEDSWGKDPCIWFEPGNEHRFGVAYLGYARKRPQPDGALNDQGLAFDAFTMPHRKETPPKNPTKKDFSYSELTSIMEHCSSVEQVYAYLEQRNLYQLNGSILFPGAMLFFTDKSGKYLVVEAHKMTWGNSASFALANFSVADTKDCTALPIERYRKGLSFLSNKAASTDLEFCTALSDTMSVNRNKIGDGTLYTNIYDLQEGSIHLFFYHDFSKRVDFTLEEELAKGAHTVAFDTLFPNNKGFQQLLDYLTPGSSNIVYYAIVACLLFFLIAAPYFLLVAFRNKHRSFMSGIAALSIILFAYLFILLRNEAIFYFPAPYSAPNAPFINLSSYVPYLLALVCILVIIRTKKVLKTEQSTILFRLILCANCIIYVLLVGCFIYWKLY